MAEENISDGPVSRGCEAEQRQERADCVGKCLAKDGWDSGAEGASFRESTNPISTISSSSARSGCNLTHPASFSDTSGNGAGLEGEHGTGNE